MAAFKKGEVSAIEHHAPHAVIAVIEKQVLIIILLSEFIVLSKSYNKRMIYAFPRPAAGRRRPRQRGKPAWG